MAHPNDSQPHSRYEFLREIGRGTFGRVVLATDTFRGDRVAVKQIELSHLQDRELFRREIVALRLARLPGVVQLRDHFESPLPPSWSGGRANVPSVAPTRPLNSAQPTRGSDRRAFAFIVMDFVPGVWFGDNRRCTWDEISSPVSQLLINLTRLHIAKIIHRDIKPQNVLVHGDQPTLLDLGISGGHALRFLSGQEGATGTVRYAAPEGRRYGRWETRSDIFSVGAMIWGVLAGRLHLGEFSTAELLHPREERPSLRGPARLCIPPCARPGAAAGHAGAAT